MYMPPWGMEEMEACFMKCFKQNFSDEYKKRYNKWGEVMTPILEKQADESMEESLATFLESKELVTVLKEKDQSIQTGELKHYQWVVHRYPITNDDNSLNYSCCRCEFPSEHVLGHI